MHPVLVRIGGFTVSTYGVVLAVAVPVAGRVFARELERRE